MSRRAYKCKNNLNKMTLALRATQEDRKAKETVKLLNSLKKLVVQEIKK